MQQIFNSFNKLLFQTHSSPYLLSFIHSSNITQDNIQYQSDRLYKIIDSVMADKRVSEASVIEVGINDQSAESVESEAVDPEKMATRAKVLKVILVLVALVCIIMVIFILAKSSQFFSYLFSLSSQFSAKTYLSQYYKAYMSSVYISIFGFVMVTADTIIFFYRFTQKDKLLYMHVVYFLTFFISSLVSIANSTYKDYMTTLSTRSMSDSLCTVNGYLNECSLSLPFLSYRHNYITFFVVFFIFLLGYVIVYHYAVTKVLPFVKEEKEKDEQISIHNANKKNETLVSEMFDEYLQ